MTSTDTSRLDQRQSRAQTHRSSSRATAVAAIATMIGALFAGGLVAWLVRRLVEAVGLRPVERALGGIFGLVRGVVAVLVLALVVNLTGLRRDRWWEGSVTAGVTTAAWRGLKPVVPERFGALLPA